MFSFPDDDIQSFSALKKAVRVKPTLQLPHFIQYSSLINSIHQLKEIYDANPVFGEMLLKEKSIRLLFKSEEDLQQLFVPLEKKHDFYDAFSFFESMPASSESHHNDALQIFLELLKYDESQPFVNEKFLLKNAAALVTSLEDFKIIVKTNMKMAKILIQSKEVQQFLTLDYLYELLSTRSQLLSLLEFSVIESFSWDEAQFLKFAALNPQLGYELLERPVIKEKVGDLKNKIGLAALQHRFPMLHAQDKKNIAALDLASVPREIKTRDYDLKLQHEKMLQMQNEKLQKRLMSVQNYFDQMMFGGASGYYSQRVDFEEDFKTFVSSSHSARALAGGFAYQMLMCRKKMIAEGKLSENDVFNVLEGGAGNGNLCFNILSIIKEMAESKDPKVSDEWKALHPAIRYHIIERSPMLAKTQSALNHQFITSQTLEVIHADAKDFGDVLSPKKMAMVISNELLDVFPPHQLIMDEKGDILVMMLVPTIHHQVLKEKFNEFFLPQKFEQLLAKLEKKSLETAQLLQMQFKNFVALSSDIYLSEADFLALHKLTIQKPELVDAFSFKEVCMHHRYFPNIAEFIENNKEFCAMMRPGQTQLLSLSIDDFIKNVANILLDNGEIISVDYGDNAFLADKRMRTYFKGKLGLNIFDKPGFKDITYDINFSDMMKRGKKYGIEPLYFGHQARLIPMHCYFPENIVSAETRRFLESHPNSKTFKVCVQVKSAPVADVVEDLTIEQTRFEKPSELVTYSALFDSFKKNLVEIKIQFKNEVSRLCDIENFMLEQKGRNMLVSHDDITHVDTLHEIFILHKIPVRRSSEKVLVISILDLPHIQKITPTNKKLLP